MSSLQIPEGERVRAAAPGKFALLPDEAEVRDSRLHVCECGPGRLLRRAANASMWLAVFRSCAADGVPDNVNIARTILQFSF